MKWTWPASAALLVMITGCTERIVVVQATAAPPQPAQVQEPSPTPMGAMALAQEACRTYDSLTGRVYLDSSDDQILRETLHEAREQALEASRQDATWQGLYGALVNVSMVQGQKVSGEELAEGDFEETLATFRAVTDECAKAGVTLTGT